MINKNDFIKRCKEAPRSYPDFYNGFYRTVVNAGCCEDVYNYMLEHKTATPSDLIRYYFKCIGGIPKPIEIVDDEALEQQK